MFHVLCHNFNKNLLKKFLNRPIILKDLKRNNHQLQILNLEKYLKRIKEGLALGHHEQSPRL